VHSAKSKFIALFTEVARSLLESSIEATWNLVGFLPSKLSFVCKVAAGDLVGNQLVIAMEYFFAALVFIVASVRQPISQLLQVDIKGNILSLMCLAKPTFSILHFL